MGRTAPKRAKQSAAAKEPTATASDAKLEVKDWARAAVLEGSGVDIQAIRDPFFKLFMDWLQETATPEQRQEIVQSGNVVIKNPSAVNKAKATAIIAKMAQGAGILYQINPALQNNITAYTELALLAVEAQIKLEEAVQHADAPRVSQGAGDCNCDAVDSMAHKFEKLAAECSCVDCQGEEAIAESEAALLCADDLDEEMLDEIKTARRYNAQFSKPPTTPSPSVRKTLIDKAVRRRDDEESPSSMEALLCFFGLRKPFSSTPLHDLSPIRIKDMKVPATHTGRYLLTRIISDPVYGQCLSFIVEDQDGRAEHVCIFNYPITDLETGADLDELFPQGQVLVIREPTFVRAFKGKSIVIRVDSPTDCLFLPPSAALLDGATWRTDPPGYPALTSVEALRLNGNSSMASLSFACAAKAYSDALALEPTPEERLVLALNRAQAHFQLENFAACYRDASIVLAYLDQGVKGPPSAEKKARFRRATALHRMRRFERALEEYELVLELDDAQSQAKESKLAIERMLEQSLTGDFDWAAIGSRRQEFDDTFDLGDYFGPIEVADMPDRLGGRGVIATRDIKVGELLLVETVFCVGTPDCDDQEYGYDLRTSTLFEAAKANLVSQLAKRIVDDPRAASLIYAVYGGRSYPPTGTLSFDMQDKDEPSLFPLSVDVDIERLEAIVHHNAVNLEQPELKYANYRETIQSGLFLGASAFNHSCAANALWEISNKFVFVRARTPIKAGDEVTVPYIPLDAPKRLFHEIMQAHFGPSGCRCSECAAERDESLETKILRLQLIDSEYPRVVAAMRDPANGTFGKRVALRSRLRQIIEKLDESYTPSSRKIRDSLSQHYSAYAFMSEMRTPADYKMLVENELKSLTCLGADLTVGPAKVEIVSLPVRDKNEELHIRFLYLARDACFATFIPNREREVRKWLRAAWQASFLMYGWTWEYFVERERAPIHKFNLHFFLASSKRARTAVIAGAL
ncbi:hypothetical protein JCM10908_001138 [Rhodotorula pacifica]|uniref:uncharacterized protein n=1 Tax=Rhodotorula pacifica TaxID=1495444 RepID=UPI00317B266C